jgi:hypothetical protein
MAFVDGENFTIRGQEFAHARPFSLIEGPYYAPNVYLWIPQVDPTRDMYEGQATLEFSAIRAYYYTSLVGDDQKLTAARTALWDLGFTPSVFKKSRQDQKAKGVDITLARDLLLHAVNDHYDVAVLLAGDADYIPLVDEVKRRGKVVYVAFFGDSGLSPEVVRASDTFFDLSHLFWTRWTEHNRKGRPSS